MCSEANRNSSCAIHTLGDLDQVFLQPLIWKAEMKLVSPSPAAAVSPRPEHALTKRVVSPCRVKAVPCHVAGCPSYPTKGQFNPAAVTAAEAGGAMQQVCGQRLPIRFRVISPPGCPAQQTKASLFRIYFLNPSRY